MYLFIFFPLVFCDYQGQENHEFNCIIDLEKYKIEDNLPKCRSGKVRVSAFCSEKRNTYFKEGL